MNKNSLWKFKVRENWSIYCALLIYIYLYNNCSKLKEREASPVTPW